MAGVKVVNCLTIRDSESVRASAPVQDVKWVSAEAKDQVLATIVDSARVKAENSSAASSAASVRASAPVRDVKWALAEAGE